MDYMAYVVVKNGFLSPMNGFVARLLNLNKPLHCYLVGRFVIQDDVAHITALLFSLYNIGWRCAQDLPRIHLY
jgi:hypothetical protein